MLVMYQHCVIEWVHGGGNMTIGQNIKRIRKEKKVSQEELKQKTGIAVETISRWEHDKFTPNIKQVERIAAALEVTPFDIMGFDYWDATIDNKQLCNEVAALEAVDSAYGEAVSKVFTDFLSLNDTGRRKAAEYIADLTEQPKYTK